MWLFKGSWFRAFIVLFCIAAVSNLAACGFEPMYGDHGAAARAADAALPDIAIGSIPERDGQYLRNILMDRLYTHGRPDGAPYELRFSRLDKNIIDLGIEKTGTATRAQIGMTTQMQLVDVASGKVLLTRTLHTVGAYNLQDDQLATLMSQQNITESILQEMRDDAVTQLGLYFRRQAAAAAQAKKPAAAPAK
ncbi:MAG: hypothetical protein KGL10_07275 [Alphaproteobacteria bacterium]|nr:hypothetical protein [Alphaproteobacteria bacterium]MDE2337095.1 hypothetical protein [Alphaproteobacteria bacterium]